MHDPIRIPHVRERPLAPFEPPDMQHPKPAIAASWTSLRIDLAEIIGRFDALENELEQLRHGKLVNRLMFDDGMTIDFERLPREELITAKLSELHDVKDRLDTAQARIAEKVAALSARDIGPRRTTPPPKPKPNPVADILDRMESDLIEVASKPAPSKRRPPVVPPSPKRRGFWGRMK